MDENSRSIMSIKHSFIKTFFFMLFGFFATFISTEKMSAENSIYLRNRTAAFLNYVCPRDATHEYVEKTYGDGYLHDIKEIGENHADYYFYDSVGKFIFYTKGSDGHESIYYWELEGLFLNENFGFYTLHDIWEVLGPPDYWSETEIRYSASFDYLIFYFADGTLVKAKWGGYSE